MQTYDDSSNIKVMLSAMLDRTLQDLFYNGDSAHKREAEKWIFSKSTTEIFNFLYVCEILDICPQTLKRRILEYKDKDFFYEPYNNKTSDFVILTWFKNNGNNGVEPVINLTSLIKNK